MAFVTSTGSMAAGGITATTTGNAAAHCRHCRAPTRAFTSAAPPAAAAGAAVAHGTSAFVGHRRRRGAASSSSSSSSSRPATARALVVAAVERPQQHATSTSTTTASSVPALPASLQALDERSGPVDIIDAALTEYGSECAIAFSGAEDVLLIEHAKRTGKPFRVFALDTARLHPETYRFFDRVEKHYSIRIEYCFPEAAAVEELVQNKGLFSFYEDGHQECCGIRKVQPLRRKLSTLRAWITGQRKDQSPGTRTNVPVVQTDPTFAGKHGDGSLVKFNPMSNVSSKEVWDTIRILEVPYNALHDKGFVSIGCEPCTRPILPGMHEREGRWWWEESTKKECGLHLGNIATGGEGDSDDGDK